MPERIPSIVTTENPWAKQSWENIFKNWSRAKLQGEYLRLSTDSASQIADTYDVACMGYLLTIRGEKSDEKTVINHVMLLKDNQLRWVERQILSTYKLQNEIIY